MAAKRLLFLVGMLLLTNIAFCQVPLISSFAPTSGAIGTSVSITGSNFSTTTTNNIVFFGATRASVTAATATQLTVTVPVGATYSPITVLVGGLIGYSSNPFHVTSGLLGIAASSFATAADFVTASGPWVVSAGDLDGDGKSDLVVSSKVDPIVSVFRNTSTLGAISYSKIDFTASNIALSNAIADVDGDGKSDLIVTNFGGSVSVFKNTSTIGNVSFNTPVDFITGSTFINAVAIGDLDSDGRADIVVSKSNGASVISIFRNTSVIGAVTMASRVDVTTGVSPESISIGDLDGDNKPEVVTADLGTGTVSIHRNTSSIGIISFATIFNVTTGTSPRSVSMGDLDGDGKKDLAVANSGSNTVSIFRNISSIGTITLATKVDLATNNPYHVSIGNLDGDGKADLAIANNNGVSAASVFKNTSISATLSFDNKVDFGSSGTYTFSSIGDLDGDTKPELVVVNFGASQVSVFKNNMGANQTITFGALPTKTVVDAPFALSATATSSLPISYTSSNASVATVSGSTVTVVGAGTTTITARQPGNATYAAAPNVQQALTVSKVSQTITFGALPAKTFGDAPFALSATATSSLPVSFTSSNNSIATVSGSTVTILGAGTIIVTASQIGNATYAAAPAVPQALTISKANQTISFGALPTKTFGDAPFALSATSTSSLPVSYNSSNTSVATIIGSTVTIVGAGTTTITSIQNGNANYNPAADLPQNLTVSKANQTLTFGALANKTFGNAQFVLSATASSGLAINFISSNTGVATVSGSTVTIVGAGTTTITASQSGNGNYNPSSNVPQNLTVNKANQTMTFGALANKTFGDPAFSLNATISSSLTISYSSSNTAVANISGNTVTIVGAGTTTITASQAGNANYNAATSVPQVLTVSKANQSITFGSLPNKTVGDAPFLLTGTTSSGLPISYISSNTSVATVSGNTVTVIGFGTTTITASQTGNSNFNHTTDVLQDLAVKENQTITFGALSDKTFGDASFALTAMSSSSLVISYASSNTAVATVSGSTVTIVGAGATTIIASQAGDVSFNPAADVDQTLAVNKANQTITFTSVTDKTMGGSAFTLSATASSGLPIAFSTISNKITIASNQVTLVSAGRATIAAVQAGSGNFNAATSIDQSFCIKPGKPSVTISNTNTESPTLTSGASAGNQWFLNGTAIAGATNTTLSITQFGTYKVKVQIDDCVSDFSDDLAIIVTGDIQKNVGSINIYPNPVTDWLTVKLGNGSGQKEVAIYQLTGKKMTSQQVSTDEAGFYVADYTKGIYVVKVTTGDAVSVIRFVKQ